MTLLLVLTGEGIEVGGAAEPSFAAGVGSDRAQASWIDPTGAEWPLTDAGIGWFTLNDVSGLGAAPITVTSDPDPLGGVNIRAVQPQPRTITWPLHIYGADHPEFLARWRRLAAAFTVTRRLGPGTLVIAQPDGTTREIRAIYEDGFTGSAGHGYLEDDIVLSLYCPDGYWRDREPTLITREYAAGTSFLDPYPTVSSSQVLGDTIVVNPGDVEAWPDWTITGPATLITATNQLTGESWQLNPNAAGIGHGPLLVGETITITTRPPTVRGPAGETWTGALNWPGATLWALQPGANPVTFAVDGAGAGTGIALSFHARYETE